MKRFHVHAHAEDSPVKIATSTRGSSVGMDHPGSQVDARASPPAAVNQTARLLRETLGVVAVGLVVMSGFMGLRSLPLSGQLWSRPDPALADNRLAPTIPLAAEIQPDANLACC